MTPQVVAYVPDLMDRSRVAAAGPEVRFEASLDDLVASAEGAALVLVDLGRPGAVKAVASVAAAGTRTIGFASHVDGALFEAAAAAGCDDVLPRSVFFRRLPELLATFRPSSG